jgi:hypothetical protein
MANMTLPPALCRVLRVRAYPGSLARRNATRGLLAALAATCALACGLPIVARATQRLQVVVIEARPASSQRHDVINIARNDRLALALALLAQGMPGDVAVPASLPGCVVPTLLAGAAGAVVHVVRTGRYADGRWSLRHGWSPCPPAGSRPGGAGDERQVEQSRRRRWQQHTDHGGGACWQTPAQTCGWSRHCSTLRRRLAPGANVVAVVRACRVPAPRAGVDPCTGPGVTGGDVGRGRSERTACAKFKRTRFQLGRRPTGGAPTGGYGGVCALRVRGGLEAARAVNCERTQFERTRFGAARAVMTGPPRWRRRSPPERRARAASPSPPCPAAPRGTGGR